MTWSVWDIDFLRQGPLLALAKGATEDMTMTMAEDSPIQLGDSCILASLLAAQREKELRPSRPCLTFSASAPL